MAWEQKGAKRYYYRGERFGPVVVRRYVGTGTVGELAAAIDEQKRAARAFESRQLQLEKDQYQEAQAPLLDLSEVANLLASASLMGAGYYQHDHGEWRRRGNKLPN